ncbi:MAG: hypothetical protein AB8G05_11840 [Oligoflexales bacterium]
MSKLIYENPKKITKKQALGLLSTGDSDNVRSALISISLHESDWRWAQNECLRFLNHEDKSIASTAIISIGHIARIHGSIDKKEVFDAFEAISNREELNEQIEDTIDDIKIFVK